MTTVLFLYILMCMRYENIVQGNFVSRPNRFIAYVKVQGKIHTVHVKNTGRCKELLTENAVVFLEKSDNPKRKTQYDLVAVMKGSRIINMDSQAPNRAVAEWLKKQQEYEVIKPEYKYGESRLDFFAQKGEKKTLIEVKGVTLEEDNVALFPDAPTQRGSRHLQELIKAKKDGFSAAVIFVIQMKGCTSFSPNTKRDPLFAEMLFKAKEAGVKIIAVDCRVTSLEMTIDGFVDVIL